MGRDAAHRRGRPSARGEHPARGPHPRAFRSGGGQGGGTAGPRPAAALRARGFRPDLYEGCHLLEQAARQDADAEGRAQAWLRLGRARALFPAEAPQFQQAGAELTRALEETEERREGGSATAARALHARGDFQRSQGRTAEALADYRAAAAEWQVLANHLADVPWAEVRETRERVAELAG